MAAKGDRSGKFFAFRHADMAGLEEAAIMEMKPRTGDVPGELIQCIEAGYLDGTSARVIFTGFGISLVHVWFKRSFPLPLHSHDADCVYYIVGGSIRLGTEDLGVGDGFFVGADVPYTYTPGPDGVELIEVRNREKFDYREKSTAAFWRKALKTVNENRAVWSAAPRLVPVNA